MIVNRLALFSAQPIWDMETRKIRNYGVSYGLSEAGYDIRIAQSIHYKPGFLGLFPTVDIDGIRHRGRFALASTIEKFSMPPNLVGVVHDKSTHARRALSVFNTVIEPGWGGYLTLELVFYGSEEVHIPAGSGIAQVLFSEVTIPTNYDGKYNGQPNHPVEAILA